MMGGHKKWCGGDLINDSWRAQINHINPRGSQPNLIVLHRHLSATSICLNEPVT